MAERSGNNAESPVALKSAVPQRLEAALIVQQLRHEWANLQLFSKL